MRSNPIKTLLIWLIIFVGFAIILNFLGQEKGIVELPFSEFYELSNKGVVQKIIISGKDIKGEFKTEFVKNGKNYKNFKTKLPYDDPELVRELTEKGIIVESKPKQVMWSIIVGYLPWVIMLGLFWFFFIRQISAGQREAIKFGKSRVKILKETKPQVTFQDVAGCEEAKEELKEVIEFLRNPEKFTKIGARIPKGVLLVGPPGTGKTLLAKAVAGEADVPFLSISGSEFVELFVGVGAARVRDLFEQAKRNAPCIVFIDEIDAVGRLRGAGLGGGHDEREQTLNQLLVEMDGFDTSEGIIVMAATNRPDILDPALLRPGRFDRQIVVPRPDVKGREEILKIHTRNIPLAEDVNLKVIAQQTPGFSGADLANLVNEAALLAARRGRDKVAAQDFEEAKDKVLMGIARRSMVMSEEDKKRIAYHEAGHALVSKFTPGSDPVHKVTIIPRGRALGATQQLPEQDRYIYSKSYLVNQLRVLLGGRAAEKIVFGEETTGAADDLMRATEIARKMVCEWGMSDKIGPVTFDRTEHEIFLGREFGVKKYYSEETAKTIDAEIKRIVGEAEQKAEEILKKNIEVLHEVAQTLLEQETITGQELDEIIKRHQVKREA